MDSGDKATKFESGVILKGSKTNGKARTTRHTFESGVILKGSKTHRACGRSIRRFESGVILKGSKTKQNEYDENT